MGEKADVVSPKQPPLVRLSAGARGSSPGLPMSRCSFVYIHLKCKSNIVWPKVKFQTELLQGTERFEPWFPKDIWKEKVCSELQCGEGEEGSRWTKGWGEERRSWWKTEEKARAQKRQKREARVDSDHGLSFQWGEEKEISIWFNRAATGSIFSTIAMHWSTFAILVDICHFVVDVTSKWFIFHQTLSEWR